jgi:hypothetical protein
VALLAAGAMALVDPRRRPARAAVAFGLVLLIGVSVHLASLPAFAASRPSTLDAALAAALASVAALVAAAVAGRAGRLSPS